MDSWSYVIIYLVISMAIGFAARRKGNTSRTFHGANLGILMCVAAGASEWMGGTSTTGVSEYGYLFGLSGAWYTIANGMGIMLCALLFSRLYRSLNSPTVSGIVGYYIGQRARSIAGTILLIVMFVVGISQMVAIGSLGQILFNIDIKASILILGVVVIAYTLFGGMVSVGYTNTMHLIVMYTGILAALVFCLFRAGGFASVQQELPASYYSMTAIGFPKISSWIVAPVLGACTSTGGNPADSGRAR